MPFFLLLPLALLSPSSPAAVKSAPSLLPSAIEEFLGPAPAQFEQRFRKPAKELKAALSLLHAGKSEQALMRLQSLTKGELAEHALYELAKTYREKKAYAKSSAQAERLLRQFPGSIYSDRTQDLIDANDCDQGMGASKMEATSLLRRCLWGISWKSWSEYEPQIVALYDHLKAAKDPLLEPFAAEIIQAMPASSAIRRKLAKDFSAEKLDGLAELARFRTKNSNPAGVKPVSPDLELFDSGMKLVLKEDWKEANAIFKRFPAEFPQSEHWERAQFWIARTEEKLGHQEEAKKRFQQILSENPFTYYGLQAALYLKHSWAPLLGQPSPPVEAKWQGSLTTRQALSLWRLRALLAEGLLDYAREEAKTLAAARANGAGIGQDDAKGALMMAALFQEAGNHMAAFSHAYAALSLDPSLMNGNSVSLIFPSPFKNVFLDAADRSGVNAMLLLSVAKQESAFLPNAISRADALGLLQLLPATAKEVLPKISRDELFQPSLNAQAGALYLYKLLDRYQGNIALSLAAYNAGPTRASQWQKELMETPLMRSGFHTDAFIDSIPFTETRKYVGNILRNYAWYKLLAKDGTIETVEELIFQWQKAPQKLEPANQAKTP